jgi:hypothetical protein
MGVRHTFPPGSPGGSLRGILVRGPGEGRGRPVEGVVGLPGPLAGLLRSGAARSPIGLPGGHRANDLARPLNPPAPLFLSPPRSKLSIPGAVAI